jgi:hypothetical protein
MTSYAPRNDAPIVVIRFQYQSVASQSSPTGNGSLLARMRRCFPVSALLASIFPGTRDHRGILNLFGPFQAARRFSSTLRQFCQEPRGVFTVLFRPSLRGLLRHEQHNGAKHGREVVEPRQAYVSQ